MMASAADLAEFHRARSTKGGVVHVESPSSRFPIAATATGRRLSVGHPHVIRSIQTGTVLFHPIIQIKLDKISAYGKD
jgi:hypothetical protein